MALSSINIVLGGDIKPLEKALDDAVVKTQKAGKELSEGAMDAVKKMSDQFAKIAQRDPSMATVRQLQNIAMTARALGPEFSDLASEVVKAAGKMKDDIGDMRAEVGYFASDTRRLDSVLGTMQGLAGAFGVAEGAMAVLGVQSEDFQKTMMKLQGIMSLVTGLQAVQNALQKESAAVQGILALRTSVLTAAQTAYTTATGGAVGAQRLLNITMAAAPWAAVAALVAAIAYSMVEYSKNANKVSATQKALNQITEETNKNFEAEAKNVGALITIVNNQAMSMTQRKNALAEIQAIYPSFLANQNLEKVGSEQLKTATANLTAEILKQARAKAVYDKLQELSAKKIDYDLIQKQAEITKQAELNRLYAAGADASQIQGFIESHKNLGSVTAKLAEQTQAQIDAIMGLVVAENLVIAPTTAATAAQNEFNKSLKQGATDAKKLSQQILKSAEETAQAEGQLIDWLEKKRFDAGEKAKKRAIEDAKKLTAANLQAGTANTPIYLDVKVNPVSYSEAAKDIQAATQALNAAFATLQTEAAASFGQFIGDMITGEQDAAKNFGKNMLGAIAAFMDTLGKAIIATAIASDAFKKLILTNPIAAAAAGIALIAGATVVRNSLKEGPNVTAFADGGIVSGPTLGLMGEYPGASTNPEVIAPLDKLQKLMKPSDSGAGFVASTHISGRDLAIVLERYNKDSRRG